MHKKETALEIKYKNPAYLVFQPIKEPFGTCAGLYNAWFQTQSFIQGSSLGSTWIDLEKQ